jgi:CHAD domain-containing protein
MNVQTLLLDALNARWDKYEAELQTCRAEFSAEAVHDFRVAARRLLALLDLLRALIRDAKIKKIRRTLKDQLDDLDELRDVQVILADISENVSEVPALKPFEEYLQRRENKLLRVARREIKTLNAARDDLSTRIRKLGKAIAESQPDGLNPLPAVDEAYANVIQRYEFIDPAQPATIHRLRIAFKKFRYMVESIHPMLEGFPSDHLKKMRDYQTTMGDIQDMEATVRELAGFEKHAPDGYDPEPVRSYYKERHAFTVSRYIEEMGEVFTFWRAVPDQSFPKEK